LQKRPPGGGRALRGGAFRALIPRIGTKVKRQQQAYFVEKLMLDRCVSC
jgi:hypothetical protein